MLAANITVTLSVPYKPPSRYTWQTVTATNPNSHSQGERPLVATAAARFGLTRAWRPGARAL